MNRRLWATSLVGALLLTSACNNSGTDDVAAPAPDGAGRLDEPMPLESSQAEPADGRQVVYTGELVVRVSSVRDATEAAVRVAADEDGFVFSQATDGDESTLTLKVPSHRFEETVDAIADLGDELRRNLQAQDVTAEVVDVEGRLKTAQASADRLRDLIAEAGTPSEVVTVEGELASRETEIESLQGRLRVLEDHVALATLDVRLTERGDLEVADDLPGFLGGLRTGFVALVNILQVLLVVLGFLIPFLPFVLLLVWGWRRHRRNRPASRRDPALQSWPPPQPQGAPGDD